MTTSGKKNNGILFYGEDTVLINEKNIFIIILEVKVRNRLYLMKKAVMKNTFIIYKDSLCLLWMWLLLCITLFS